MKKQKFHRATENSLIVISCSIGKDPIAIAIDTGASHTTMDINQVLLAEYNMKDAIGVTQIETASGVIDAFIFRLKEFSCLGITRQNVDVCAYDFLAHHLLTDFDGVLGLDFFEGMKFCIDMDKSIITIQ